MTRDAGELRGKRASLVVCQLVRELRDLTQFLADDHAALDRRALVGHLELGAVGVERRGVLERGVRGAASAQGTASVAHAREEAELEQLLDMRATGERRATLRLRDQL